MARSTGDGAGGLGVDPSPAGGLVMKGIATLRSARAMTPQEIQNVRALYEQGLTAEEIARRTGRWVGTVRKHLRGRVSTPAA